MEVEGFDGGVVRVDVAHDGLGGHNLLLIDNFGETLVETDSIHGGKVKAVHRVPKVDPLAANTVTGDGTEDEACLRRSHETVGRKESVASAVRVVSFQSVGRLTAARTPRQSQAWIRRATCSPSTR